MKALFIAAILAFVNIAPPASAGGYDGNFLLDFCSQKDMDLQNGCTGFTTGLFAALFWMNRNPVGDGGLPNKFCPPKNLSPVQVQDIIIRYVEREPQFRHHEAAVLALMALWDAFPCPGQ